MPTLRVDGFVFLFEPTIAAQRYDKWRHYITAWNAAGGRKAVDVVAVEVSGFRIITWLIEAKDFRIITNPPKPSNIGGLAQSVADKARDTLSGLADAAVNAASPSEKSHAAQAIVATSVRIVLHLEPHVGAHTALFPAGFPASVLQRLRQLVRAIDPDPLVLSIANTAAAGVPWTVT
jgi:hypothetical protein